jgi:hypothetical protein
LRRILDGIRRNNHQTDLLAANRLAPHSSPRRF